MDLKLKPRLQEFVTEKLKTGQYSDASAVVNEALEMMMDCEQFTPEHEAYIRREVLRGVEEADRGEYADFDAKSIIAEQRALKFGNQSET